MFKQWHAASKEERRGDEVGLIRVMIHYFDPAGYRGIGSIKKKSPGRVLILEAATFNDVVAAVEAAFFKGAA